MAHDLNEFTGMTPGEVVARTDRDSYGVVRILNSSAGTPGDVREYKEGDEVLVENGLADWVVAPVHGVSAGRRLDGAGRAEVAATPMGGIEAFPNAESYDHGRDAAARRDGFVEAYSADGLAGRMAAKREEVAAGLADESDVKLNASLGSLGARSGPVTSRSELPADKAIADASAAGDEAGEKQGSARSGGSAPGTKGK